MWKGQLVEGKGFYRSGSYLLVTVFPVLHIFIAYFGPAKIGGEKVSDLLALDFFWYSRLRFHRVSDAS